MKTQGPTQKIIPKIQAKKTSTERFEAILDDVKKTIADRGKERDMDDGERTIPRCVTAFNAITGYTLSNEDGWLFMQVLKQCRSKQGKYKYDDFRDGIGYAALRAEEAQMTHENDEFIPDIILNEDPGFERLDLKTMKNICG